MNIRLAEKILYETVQAGIEEFCLCPGARNSPFVVLLEKAKGIKVHSFFEERSAAFFALGRVKKTGRPVAIVTTSGTAAAEMLPAAIEATYTGLPLLFITADRPRSYRGKGAPQSIEQIGIYSHYVQSTIDIENIDEKIDFQSWNLKQPLHLNVCFDEPLIDGEIPALNLTSVSSKIIHERREKLYLHPQKRKTLRRPIIIVGELDIQKSQKVAQFLLKIESPIYAESISNLRGISEIKSLLLSSGEKSISKAFEEGLYDSVLRIGGIPTLRFWRDLEEKFKNIPVTSVSETDYTGLSRSADHMVGYHNLEFIDVINDQNSNQKILMIDQELNQNVQKLLEKFPFSEPSLIKKLSQKMNNHSIYLGNSLPIREWDLVTTPNQHFMEIHANRGANGIDGQISTFLGLTEDNEECWCLVGDLTAMYDLAALWPAQSMKNRKLRIVIINNNGGQIFRNMFSSPQFINKHQIQFQKWAEMWNWSYQQLQSISHDNFNLSEREVIEICPNNSDSEKFWQEYKKL